VLAYALVEPDRFAERIYVRDTSAQLVALANSSATAAGLPCADLLSALTANASSSSPVGAGPAPATGPAAWAPGALAEATAACAAQANETAVATARLAVQLLQAFVDLNGRVPLPILPHAREGSWPVCACVALCRAAMRALSDVGSVCLAPCAFACMSGHAPSSPERHGLHGCWQP
jgi:hypothetical protein